MNATHNGVWLRYPDTCNCCDYCLTNIGVDGNCGKGLPGMQPPTDICGPGLECTMNNNGIATCQKMQTTCTKAQNDYDKRRADGNLGILQVRPVCDEDGLFAPYHCIPGSICFCVSPVGTRIFGETVFLNVWDEQRMTCGCSLNDWNARNTLDPNNLENDKVPVLGARCNEYGQFDALQCMVGNDANCTCVDPVAGYPNNAISLVTLPNLKKGNPPCFDEARHQIGIYDTECEIMKSAFLNDKITMYKNPICQPDGMFHRVQILDSRKVCVDPSGQQIVYNGTSYFADLNSPESEKIDCNCARSIWLLSQAGVKELPMCSLYGNYKTWQCHRNECYCVDSNGDQCGSEQLPINDAEKLSCYSSQSLECKKSTD